MSELKDKEKKLKANAKAVALAKEAKTVSGVGIIQRSRILSEKVNGNPGKETEDPKRRAKPKRGPKGKRLTKAKAKELLKIKIDPEAVRELARSMLLKDPYRMRFIEGKRNIGIIWPITEKIFDYKFVHQGKGMWGQFYNKIKKIVEQVQEELRSELAPKAVKGPGA